MEILEYDLVVVKKDQTAADDSIAMEPGFIERFELRDILGRKRLRRQRGGRQQTSKNSQKKLLTSHRETSAIILCWSYNFAPADAGLHW
jgi:hypothetical protein